MSPSTLAASLLALVAPVRCSGCGKHDVSLCEQCGQLLRADLVRELPPLYLSGQRITVLSAGIYAGARRQAMLDFKNGGQRRLAGTLMGAILSTGDPGHMGLNENILVVPVPSSLRGGWNRGYWPSLLLAREIARGIPGARVAPIVVPRWRVQALLRSRFTRRSRRTRLLRSSQDFRVKTRHLATGVIVVDDVAVTGATVRAVCGVLVDAGFRCHAAVVAADVPHG